MLNKWVFQIDSPLINAQRDRDNYLVDYTDGDSKVCAIYFSSHNIYYPNDRAAFQEAIITKDKYEWYGTRIKRPPSTYLSVTSLSNGIFEELIIG